VRGLRHRTVRLEHLIIAMLDDAAAPAGQALLGSGVTGARARRYLKELRGTAPEPSPAPADIQLDVDLRPFAPELFAVLTSSAQLVVEQGLPFIRTDHLLLSIVETPHNTGWDMLGALGVDQEGLSTRLRSSAAGSSTEAKTKSYRSEETAVPGGVLLRMTTPTAATAGTARPAPTASEGTQAMLSALLDEVRQLRSEVAAIRSSPI
jgi:ATP-dependent Clp protease ATP-binding subunit ClpA